MWEMVKIMHCNMGTFLIHTGSCFLLSSDHGQAGINHVAEEKTKTKDILAELYPPLSDGELDKKVNTAVMQFVSYNTENTPSLERFATIQNQSNCLFAKKARVWGSPPWIDSLSVGQCAFLLSFSITVFLY